MYILKHIVLSQKNADRKKKCIETAKMMKKNYNIQFLCDYFKTFKLKVDNKKIGKIIGNN